MPAPPDLTLFTSAGLELELAGVAEEQADHLVERFNLVERFKSR